MPKFFIFITCIIISSNIFAISNISKLALTKSDFLSIKLNLTNSSFDKKELSDKMDNVIRHINVKNNNPNISQSVNSFPINQ